MRITDAIRRREQRLDDLSARLVASQRDSMQAYRRRLELATVRVRHQDLRRHFQSTKKELQGFGAQLSRAMRTRLFAYRARLEQAAARLEALSPLKILERGYAVVFDAAGMPISSAQDVNVGDALSIRLAKGSLGAEVTEVKRPSKSE
jgi:exodeoxyribonuclease VII large subunit